MKTILEIKKDRETSTTELMNSCGVFWAFSRSQFEENKTPLKEGEKYVDIGAGGFMPKGNVDKYIAGMKEIAINFKNQIAENGVQVDHILYELHNHECFYTGNIDSAFEVLEHEGYSKEMVLGIFHSHSKSTCGCNK